MWLEVLRPAKVAAFPLPQVFTAGEFAEAYKVSASLSLIVELACTLINQEIKVKRRQR